ncbi:hypothetical protein [Roseomonas indoligenes]|uniref:Uncharacterized protein n=1 Tax=Roseomonas indoligenes TaxID=2820811 RepID=A0A940S4P9_9PROT|nr:hypothetical protein [Pararoseomonas indoligenes]MBP0492209.1 hypothetical protein [Pararoseomonas indoligenes]
MPYPTGQLPAVAIPRELQLQLVTPVLAMVLSDDEQEELRDCLRQRRLQVVMQGYAEHAAGYRSNARWHFARADRVSGIIAKLGLVPAAEVVS